MSLNLHLLRLFTTVVRTRSFSRAADALHIIQPAISKGVRDFERQFGCRLLARERGCGSREVVAQALAAAGIEPMRTLEIGSTEAIKQAVAAGLGVAIVSSATISDQVTLGRLKVVQIRDLQIERTLWQLKVPGRIEI